MQCPHHLCHLVLTVLSWSLLLRHADCRDSTLSPNDAGTMADDINIDPALSQPPSSVVSDLTPLASPALSPFTTPALPSRPASSLANHHRDSRHASPDIAVPAVSTSTPHVQANGSNTSNNNTASLSTNNSTNSDKDDVPVPQLHSQPAQLPPKPPVIATAGVKRKVDDSNVIRCPYKESKKCKKEYKHKNGECAFVPSRSLDQACRKTDMAYCIISHALPPRTSTFTRTRYPEPSI